MNEMNYNEIEAVKAKAWDNYVRKRKELDDSYERELDKIDERYELC